MSIIIIRKTPKTIVKPEPVVEVKPTAQAVRYYPDGLIIANTLPESYVPAETNLPPGAFQRNCGNCKAYVSISSECVAYNARVRPTYVCASWHSVI
jgi:hypothetical protein